MTEIGNPQENELAWLAGILDGEGSISVQAYTLPDGRVRLTPFVGIVNSDLDLLNEVKSILAEIGVAFRLCNAVGSVKKVWNLRVDGQEPVKRLCEAVMPYLRSFKKTNAKVVLMYLESRKARGIERNILGHLRRTEYSRAEIELISSIRSHKSAKSSETLCRAPNVLG